VEITIEDLLTMRSGLESTSGRNYGAWVNSRNWVQSSRDLSHARHALDDDDHEWAAFAAQQAAEKALKALVMAEGGASPGGIS
jgi:CubicO group peptidase (beta-lactamase class C family)